MEKSGAVSLLYSSTFIVALACFWSEQFAVAVDTGPIAVDKGHGIAAHGTFRWRALVDAREIREFEFVFVFVHAPTLLAGAS